MLLVAGTELAHEAGQDRLPVGIPVEFGVHAGLSGRARP